MSVFIEPLVFQRRESAALRFVPGRLEMCLAESAILSSSNRTGRELTRSSRLKAQSWKCTSWTVPVQVFVLLSSNATAFVTERSSNRIPPGALAAPSAGLDSSTMLIVLSLPRRNASFAAGSRHRGDLRYVAPSHPRSRRSPRIREDRRCFGPAPDSASLNECKAERRVGDGARPGWRR